MTADQPAPQMQRALDLAQQALWLTSPNPRVGCVIASADGRTLLGQGHTQRAGGPHAEVMALRDATAQGHDVRGASAWVTLEPCAHQGRTGPCCDALIAAGIARVVVAMIDPNPLVAGQGLARLQAAGVATELLPPTHPQALQAHELNIGFFKRMTQGLPWVRMKIAASIDGQTALGNGQSQWITSAAARADGHAWRARACAVLTGIGTVLEDDPVLTVRELNTPRQPHLVLVDSRLELPLTAKLLHACPIAHAETGAGAGAGVGAGTHPAASAHPAPGQARQIWLYTACSASSETREKRAALSALGVQVIDCPSPGGKVDLAAMLRDLAARQVNELHVEAGHKLNGSFMREGLVDEWLLYLAPQWLGPGQGMAHLPALSELSQALKLRFHAAEAVGPDLRLLLRPAARAAASAA